MGASNIPDLQFTPIEVIQERASTLRKTFLEHKTRDVEFRLKQLRKLYWAVKDNEEKIVEALAQDLGRPRFESEVAESGWVQNDIVFVSRNLHKWMKEEKAEDIDLSFKLMNPKIRKDPLGCVLVIGAFNFPFQLTLGPVIGAIAAGNTVVIKPSENAPKCAVVIQQIVEASLDPSCYTVIQGGVPEVQALLAGKWDKIFFTGGATVGRIIAKAAAPNLTPVVLELGGINPAIITKTANPRLVARRMLWGKHLNAGQICTSQNYLLVDRAILPAVIEEFKKAYKEFYPQGAKASPDYSRIINEGAFQKLKTMIDNSKGKILMGGTMDEKDLFIEPTLVQVDSPDDSLIIQESFGPLIPILPVDNLDEAVNIANGIQSTPLGVYPFGNKADTEKILALTRSGGAAVNDAALHIPTLAFGGVGESGYGAYRGRASFDAFVHRRPITTSPSWLEAILAIRYPPYAGKLSKLKATSTLAPDFDRNGDKIRFGWLRMFLTLGGGTAKAGAGRAAVVAVGE
ncbi:hexadecenal dehydrogenase [Aspergillus clavatus NRRL 1]|uniref:Aldehyde dehydrogenase n=1 Tax=Aspergillus clavatus (strain ATCC 1007 / CBS 513.65 / DSM 816 / NCTC 3887 / NRRL 1 / QM 1276 / 107) TaxID=344612 RepID=A1CIR9_ASPCL|nr:aldehyde dehydrogenase, putative [Aspergillus clavatus NRRL 1]EAW10774.1 aldehyde dehydrogenase, putative [Aspergillus clavatus NRRL 1]